MNGLRMEKLEVEQGLRKMMEDQKGPSPMFVMKIQRAVAINAADEG
jgi:hypothetical protein